MRQEGEAPRIGQGLYEVQQAVRGQPSQPSAASQEQLLRYYQLQGRLPAGAKVRSGLLCREAQLLFSGVVSLRENAFHALLSLLTSLSGNPS